MAIEAGPLACSIALVTLRRVSIEPEITRHGLEVIKHFSCSIQLSMNFKQLLINDEKTT